MDVPPPEVSDDFDDTDPYDYLADVIEGGEVCSDPPYPHTLPLLLREVRLVLTPRTLTPYLSLPLHPFTLSPLHPFPPYPLTPLPPFTPYHIPLIITFKFYF